MGMRSFVSLALEVGVIDGLHEVESDSVDNGNFSNAALVDSAGGNIGSGSGNCEAESPAGLVEFLSTFFSTFFELIFTSRGSLALLILIRTSLLNAFDEFG